MGRTELHTSENQLARSFQEICQTLQQDRFRDRHAKPLAFWTLPNDRRLPLKLLDRSVGDLIHTEYADLAATQGIGEKKIQTLVKLLIRATDDKPPTIPVGQMDARSTSGQDLRVDSVLGTGGSFNARLVSEALWSEWTTTVRQFGMTNEPLGRVAESLAHMPTVIWAKRLGEYAELSLSQIRRLRTHGEKRVRCVMRVFHRIHEVAQQHPEDEARELRRRLVSKRIITVSNWLSQQLAQEGLPALDEVRVHLADPILEQVRTDCGETVYQIAAQRLGVDETAMTVRQQAQELGVTRARIYQLLEECHKALDVRWEGGRELLDRMTVKYGAFLGIERSDPSLFLAVRQLCFPDRSEMEEPRSNYADDGKLQRSGSERSVFDGFHN